MPCTRHAVRFNWRGFRPVLGQRTDDCEARVTELERELETRSVALSDPRETVVDLRETVDGGVP
ncbi:MAG: hypothetical protein ABEJ05_03030 [Haloglomus sp.]